MDKAKIVVTYHASSERKVLLQEVLGSVAALAFLDSPNVLGTPHNSAVVPGVMMGATRQAAENVQRFLKGEQVIGIAQREDYLHSNDSASTCSQRA